MKREWEIIHDSDDEEGNPTCWFTSIDNKKYGKRCWISDNGEGFDIEVDFNTKVIITIMTCKTLTSAKRWVSRNL